MPKSSTFCCCSIRTAGIVVAIVELILCILSIYGLVRNLILFGSPYFLWFLLGIVSTLIILLVVFLLLYAIRTEQARLLVPHLTVQFFLILFLLIVALVVALLLIFGAYPGIRALLGHVNYYMSDDSTVLVGFMIIAVYLFVAALEVLFLYIIYKLFRYLQEYRRIAGAEEGEVYAVKWQNSQLRGPIKTGSGARDAGDTYPYGNN